MSSFKTGNILIGPHMSERWKYIGEHEGNAYLVPIGEGMDTDAAAIPFNSDLKGWKLAPKPFFEEGKTYESLNDYRFTVWHVHEMTNGRVAVGQWTSGNAGMLMEEDFELYTEV